MEKQQAEALRKPFPKEVIQKLPVSKSLSLDYVSHAHVTDRLLQVDPNWTWEPVGFDEYGLPKLDAAGGLWIKLTVCGVTRYGYGEPQGHDQHDKVKGAIGNALRVAAMRFGVGLDLWMKEPVVPNESNAEIDNLIALINSCVAIPELIGYNDFLAEKTKTFTTAQKKSVTDAYTTKKEELNK